MKTKISMIALLVVLLVCGFCACNQGNASELDRIYVSQQPTRVVYTEGERFDADGMEISAVYIDSNGNETEKVITDEVEISDTVLVADQKAVTIYYTENEITKSCEVAVTVEKKLVYTQISVPESDIVIENSIADNLAKSYWDILYTENGISVSVVVEDNNIYTDTLIYNTDGIEIFLYKQGRIQGIPDGVVQVIADVSGGLIVKESLSTKFNEVTAHNVSIDAEMVGFTSTEKAEGYRIEIILPYSLVEGLSFAEKNATIAFGLTNAADFTDIQTVFYNNYDTEVASANTYAMLTADNSLSRNDWFEYGYNFGDGGALKMTNGWDLTYDDGTDNSYITLNSIDSANYIYMHRVATPNLYAEMQISAREVLNGERSGKFGISIYNEDGEGYFFYIAASGDGTNMTGTSVGYVTRRGGSWSGYTTINGVSVSASEYQNNNFVTFGVYRQGALIQFYLGNECVAQVGGIIDQNESAYVSINSFNILLTVKNAEITNDSDVLNDYQVAPETVDYLFIGDSYVSTSFWTTFDQEFSGESAVNMGIEGTKIAYWKDAAVAVSSMYIPENIVIHISLNDINGGTSAEETISQLTDLFATYRELLPDTDLYWISLSPNNYSPENWNAYQQVNDAVSFMNGVTYIDLAQYLGSDAGTEVAQYYNIDGLHFNLDGYALWTREIKKALGITRTTKQSGLGDAPSGNSGEWAYTNGWVFTSDYAENTESGRQSIYFAETAGTSFYVSVDITALQALNSDSYPKLGLMLRSDSKTVFYYLDGSNNFVNLFSNVGICLSGETWTLDNTQRLYTDAQYVYDQPYSGENYKTLGILKIGTAVYFLADNQVVAYAENLFDDSETIFAGVMSWNAQIRVKNAVQYQGNSSEFSAKCTELRIAAKSTSITVNGDAADWTATMKSNALFIPATDSGTSVGGQVVTDRGVTIYATMEQDGVYILYEAIHASLNTEGSSASSGTHAEFIIGDAYSRFVSANGHNSRWSAASNTRQIGVAALESSVVDGLQHTTIEIFIPYSMIEGYDANSDYIPAGFVFNPGGDTAERSSWASGTRWYTPDAAPLTRYVFITKSGIMHGTEKLIDGNWDDWDTTELVSVTKTMENVSGSPAQSKFAAYLGEDGLYGIWSMSKDVINVSGTCISGNYARNTNFEFRFNDLTAYAAWFDEELYGSGRLTQYKGVYSDGDMEDTITVEFFVAYEAMGLTEKPQSVQVKLLSRLYDEPFAGTSVPSTTAYNWYVGNGYLNVTANGIEN